MATNVFFTVFLLIFVAELPDKTAFATFLMATRGRASAIFTGVAAAFLIQSLVAVAFGSMIGLLPEKWVHGAAGLLFLGFAAYTVLFHDREEAETEQTTPVLPSRADFWKAFAKAFTVIFIAEWGDLTQIATASLAARYHGNLLIVFMSATLALWLVTGLAVLGGQKAGQVVHVKHLKTVSAVFMAAAGIYFLVGAWTGG